MLPSGSVSRCRRLASVDPEDIMNDAKTLVSLIDNDVIGQSIYALAAEIFPICRSITGDGVRRTLDVLGRHVPIQRHEISTGSAVLDWVVPKEWNITDAYIKNAKGERVVDFHRSNLHVLNYSAPVRAKMPFVELKAHVFTLPDQPDLVPYRTSYYEEAWGFWMSHRQLSALEEAGGEYEVVIESRLEPGALTWGEYLHLGQTEEEVLLSAHVCHPSLANDNCSGLALLAVLAHELAARRTRLSYRILFCARNGRFDRLARRERGLSRPNKARSRGLLRGRCRRAYLQAEPPRQRTYRPCYGPCAARIRDLSQSAGFLSVWL